MTESSRDQIVAEAGRMFSERGFRETSVAEIAAAAGKSEASAFRIFGTKADLFAAAVAACSDVTLDLSDLAMNVHLTDVRADLKAIVHEMFRLHIENIHLIRLSVAGRMQFPELRDAGAFVLEPLREWFRAYLNELVSRGQIRVRDLDLAVDLVCGAVFGDVLQATVVHQFESYTPELATAVDDLWRARVESFCVDIIEVVAEPTGMDTAPRGLTLGTV